jgi:RHS repeat-associated protein
LPVQYLGADDLISAFSYDADGNPVSGSIGGVSTSLTWNDNDKLVSLTNASNLTESNIYGADGLRYAASVGGVTRYFVYAGGTLLGEVSANGTPIAAYTWGNGLISQRRFDTATGTPTSSWYLYGAQGETRALTDSTGTVTDTYTYSAYGTLVASTGSTTNAFRYGGGAGYYTDSATGLVLCGQRWYAPGYGRWLNADPIGYDGGDNRYVYCGDQPVGGIDPSGERGGKTGVTDSQSDGEIEQEIKKLLQDLNGGGLTPQERAALKKEINLLEQKLKKNQKGSGDRNKKKREGNRHSKCKDKRIPSQPPVPYPEPEPDPAPVFSFPDIPAPNPIILGGGVITGIIIIVLLPVGA